MSLPDRGLIVCQRNPAGLSAERCGGGWPCSQELCHLEVTEPVYFPREKAKRWPFKRISVNGTAAPENPGQFTGKPVEKFPIWQFQESNRMCSSNSGSEVHPCPAHILQNRLLICFCKACRDKARHECHAPEARETPRDMQRMCVKHATEFTGKRSQRFSN